MKKIILSTLAISLLSGLAHASVFEGTSELAWSSYARHKEDGVAADQTTVINEVLLGTAKIFDQKEKQAFIKNLFVEKGILLVDATDEEVATTWNQILNSLSINSDK